MNLLRFPLATLAAALLAACNSMPERDPDYASTRPAAPAPVAVASGSIYQAGQGLALFEDTRPRRVGDILIVRLVENTNASKTATTNTKKENAIDIGVPNVLGTTFEFDLPRGLPLNNTRNLNLSAGLDSSQEFKGNAGSTQKNSLIGSISVTVAEVLANGNLVVRGEKVIGINQGHEHVRLSGIVRPQDIQSDNSVLSTQIADARIAYGGTGVLADSNDNGWLARFFNSPWWPF
jgi:flagellar L-ring protein precursor FlgH